MRNAVELHIISAENIRYYWVDLLLEIIIKLIAIGPLILSLREGKPYFKPRLKT